MILDTSALLAILQMEPEAEEMSAIVSSADVVRLSAASYVEASMCIERLADTVRKAMFEDVLREFEIRVEPVTFEQASAARQAFRDFGKGRHPAGLNYGDCFTYALAKTMREPVLFKGDDFSQTDLTPAWTPPESV